MTFKRGTLEIRFWIGRRSGLAGQFQIKILGKGVARDFLWNDPSSLKKIFTAGFDGVYLDIIGAFEYFEIMYD